MLKGGTQHLCFVALFPHFNVILKGADFGMPYWWGCMPKICLLYGDLDIESVLDPSFSQTIPFSKRD